MLVVILTCLVLAGESLTLTPPTGWEIVKIRGIVTSPSFTVGGSVQLCLSQDCPLPKPAAQKAEVVVKRRLLVEEVTVPKGCDVRVESEGKTP